MSSNIIKGYSQNYDSAKFKKLDMTAREEILAEKIEDLRNKASGFVSGLIPAEVMDESLLEGENYPENTGEMNEELLDEGGFQVGAVNDVDMATLRNQIRDELYAEVRIQAEADFRENFQAEADRILIEARENAEQIIAEAESRGRAEAEAIKNGIVSVASAEGYESGLKKAKEEQAAALKALEDEKRRVTEEYERQVAVLEPAFVEILKEYIRKITGVAYDHHTEILTYLMDQAIKKVPGQTEFIVKLSPNDSEKYANEIPGIIEAYNDKLQLTFSASAEVKDGEVRLENEGRILTSSLELNMNGLLESLDLLSRDSQ